MSAKDRHEMDILPWFLAAEFAFGTVAILTFLFVGGELGLAIFAFCMIGFLVSFSVVVIQPDLTRFKTYQESDILDDEFEL